jgi:hypothetical protein
MLEHLAARWVDSNMIRAIALRISPGPLDFRELSFHALRCIRGKQEGPGMRPGPKEMGTRRIGIAQYAAKGAAGFAQVMRQSGQINTTGR